MILKRLAEYYDRLAADPATAGELPRWGYSRQKLSFCVVLNPDGSLNQFQSLLDVGGGRPEPLRRLVPGAAKPSGKGINPGFLWDNIEYMLGVGVSGVDPEKEQRLRRTCIAFRDRHTAVEDEINDPAFSAVCRFLERWGAGEWRERVGELATIASHFGVFRIAGEQTYVHERPAVTAYWERLLGSDEQGEVRQCLVTGTNGLVARLHEPKIKGVPGSQPAGAPLVSFNETAYTSYGHDQGNNAPVSRSIAFKYTNALNALLERPDRRIRLGTSTVVFWAEHAHPVEGFINDLFGDERPEAPAATEDQRRVDEVRRLVIQLRDGYAASAALGPDRDTRFFILALSPNAARLSVRFWYDTTVGDMLDRLGAHLRDTTLVGARDYDPPLTIKAIVRATGRAIRNPRGKIKGYDDAVSPLLADSLARAVLGGTPYPRPLLAAMVSRLRADGAFTHARLAAIKACLNRNTPSGATPLEVPVSLDITRTDAAYVTGRLFALLERIQEHASTGALNATIKDRYYSSASATPAIAFPRLLRLAQHHLAKLEGGRKVTHEKMLGEIMGKLDGFAPQFGLRDQGQFAIGYYHQRQAFFLKRDEQETETL
jgi:CRISPR-associated protein Csd1